MLFDTSVLVAWTDRPPEDPVVERIRELAGEGPVIISPIQFGELADIARKHGIDAMTYTQEFTRAEQVPLTMDVAIEGSRIKAQARKRAHSRDFSLIDGILLASARSAGVELVTLDRDFEGFDDCVVVA